MGAAEAVRCVMMVSRCLPSWVISVEVVLGSTKQRHVAALELLESHRTFNQSVQVQLLAR